MASKVLYDPHVVEELGKAFVPSRANERASEAIKDACASVIAQEPISKVMGYILNAMQASTKVSVLYSLSQAVAWIGPMDQ